MRTGWVQRALTDSSEKPCEASQILWSSRIEKSACYTTNNPEVGRPDFSGKSPDTANFTQRRLDGSLWRKGTHGRVLNNSTRYNAILCCLLLYFFDAILTWIYAFFRPSLITREDGYSLAFQNDDLQWYLNWNHSEILFKL